MKIFLFGKYGQLAKQFINDLDSIYDLIVFGSNEINFKKTKTLEKLLEKHEPDIVINTAAYTKVDLAEKNKKEAFLINSEALKTIAKSCNKIGAKLFHFSTDYVFDGKKESPYNEIDKPNPLNIYGRSKFQGELNIINSNCNFYIIRLSWLMSIYNNNFIEIIVSKLKKGENLEVINDQIGSPTSTKLIVQVTNALISLKEKYPKEILHVSPKGYISWFDLAVYINQKMIKKNLISDKNKIKPITSFNYGSIAKRPKNSIFNHEKIENKINKKMPRWEIHMDELIEFHISKIKNP